MMIRRIAAVAAAMVLTAACLTGCVTVTISGNSNSAADEGLETIEDDHWVTTYNPDQLTMFVNEDETLFSYTEEGVDISGSQYVSFKFIPDKTAQEVIDEKKIEYNEPDAQTYESVFGTSSVHAITYLVGSRPIEPAEGSELAIAVDFSAMDVDGGTVLVESYSTLGDDEETGYKIAAAFEQLMDTLEVK